MKKFLMLSMLMPLLAFGAISTDKEYKLTEFMGPTAKQVDLGTLLERGGEWDLGADGYEPLKVVRATYDYATHGGSSTTDIDLGVTIPSSAIIVQSWIDTITAPQGSGSSIGIYTEAAGDIVATATGISTFSGITAGVSTGTAANMKKMTANRAVKVDINGANGLTAGKFVVFIKYVVSR